MRLRNTLILASAALLLAAYYFVVEQPRQRRADKQESRRTSITDFRIHDVGHVVIHRSDVTMEFTKAGNSWMMTAPLIDHAENGAINQLLGILADGEIHRDLGLQEDLSAYGLDVPAATIAVVLSSGDTITTIAVGNLTLDSYYAYARPLNENRVLLVPTGIRRYALAEFAEFRNKRLVYFGLPTVTSFALHWPGRTMAWQRQDNETWVTSHDGNTIVGRTRYVEAVLRYLQGMRVSEFVPDNQLPEVRPFDTPARAITVNLIDGTTQTVNIGRRLESRL